MEASQRLIAIHEFSYNNARDNVTGKLRENEDLPPASITMQIASVAINSNPDNIKKMEKEKVKKLRMRSSMKLSKKEIISAYNLGESYIPWSNKLEQFSDLAPDDMCITKLNYSHGKLTIS